MVVARRLVRPFARARRARPSAYSSSPSRSTRMRAGWRACRWSACPARPPGRGGRSRRRHPPRPSGRPRRGAPRTLREVSRHVGVRHEARPCRCIQASPRGRAGWSRAARGRRASRFERARELRRSRSGAFARPGARRGPTTRRPPPCAARTRGAWRRPAPRPRDAVGFRFRILDGSRRSPGVASTGSVAPPVVLRRRQRRSAVCGLSAVPRPATGATVRSESMVLTGSSCITLRGPPADG